MLDMYWYAQQCTYLAREKRTDMYDIANIWHTRHLWGWIDVACKTCTMMNNRAHFWHVKHVLTWTAVQTFDDSEQMWHVRHILIWTTVYTFWMFNMYLLTLLPSRNNSKLLIANGSINNNNFKYATSTVCSFSCNVVLFAVFVWQPWKELYSRSWISN